MQILLISSEEETCFKPETIKIGAGAPLPYRSRQAVDCREVGTGGVVLSAVRHPELSEGC